MNQVAKRHIEAQIVENARLAVAIRNEIAKIDREPATDASADERAVLDRYLRSLQDSVL
jgi:hypothetical protein